MTTTSKCATCRDTGVVDAHKGCWTRQYGCPDCRLGAVCGSKRYGPPVERQGWLRDKKQAYNKVFNTK